jgi:starch synthase
MDGAALGNFSREVWAARAARRVARSPILMAASEIYPLAKTGGLGDVCGALPKALNALGADVRLILPAYESATDTALDLRVATDLGEICGVPNVRLLAGFTPDAGLPVWLVDCPDLYRRAGSPYLDAAGIDWPDNDLRFGVFCHAVARCARSGGALGWSPHVVHCHDWQTGLVPLLLARANGHRVRSVFTTHNAAFQGNFGLDCATRLGLPQELLGPDGIEFYGRLSFLKAGVLYADALTTVSPRYAREICTPEFGCGLDGVFRARAGDLVGILNGIDTALWNPGTDPHIAAHFCAGDTTGKHACKADLQRELHLAEAPDRPLAAFVARLTTQKMADIVLERLPHMLARHPDLQWAVLGRGERALEQGFAALAPQFPGRLGVRIGYAEPIAHRVQAGADLLLHGARFEPCGLSQMHAMRYGTVPVVRRVGGLAESVVDIDDAARAERPATGFAFDQPTGDAMDEAMDRCLHTYRASTEAWHQLQANGMAGDFGWERSARRYLDVYAGRSVAAAGAAPAGAMT